MREEINENLIYISHSSTDSEIGNSIIKYLRDNGLNARSANQILIAGDPMKQIIQDSIKFSSAVVFVVTENFLSSEGFEFEVQTALNLKKRIIPIVIKDYSIIRNIPAFTNLRALRYPEEKELLLYSLLEIIDQDVSAEPEEPLFLESDVKSYSDVETFSFRDFLIFFMFHYDISLEQFAKMVDYSEWYIRLLVQGRRSPGNLTYERFYIGLKENSEIPQEELDAFLHGGNIRYQESTDAFILLKEKIEKVPDDYGVLEKQDSLIETRDKTPFHKDSPALVDKLGRKGFAEALATWIDRYWDDFQGEERSFIINIHGQWGAGKTSLLYLIESELIKKKDKKWITVWFNAWENHHIQPVWWPLIDTIFNESVNKLDFGSRKWRLWLKESWRRLKIGWSNRAFGVFVVSLVIVFVAYWSLREGYLPDNHFLARVSETVKPIVALLGLIGTVYSAAKLFSQTLFFGSPKNAETYLQMVPDPITKIKNNFYLMVEDVDAPILVFIDDLDRCDVDYMVSLLESLQTILNHEKVFYIIAADQRWLTSGFEEKYKVFTKPISEPGKKLGYLFLEKIFQLTFSLPNISTKAQGAYLNYLLGMETIPEKIIEEKREELAQEFQNITSEAELVEMAEESEATEFEEILRKEAAVVQSASLEIEKSTEHFLMDFVSFMEANPRSMKRLVTYYGILRAVALLTDLSIISDEQKRIQLALWAIAKLRWPDITDYLEDYPEHSAFFQEGSDSEELPDLMQRLAQNKHVNKVFQGINNAKLDEDAVKRMVMLKSAG